MPRDLSKEREKNERQKKSNSLTAAPNGFSGEEKGRMERRSREEEKT